MPTAPATAPWLEHDRGFCDAMQRIPTERTPRPWAALATLALCLPAATPALTQGVVVEEMDAASALAQAGIEVGDALVAWKRPAAPPEGAAGTFTSIFDWLHFVTEEAPRGPVGLTVIRQGASLTVEPGEGSWNIRVRPGIEAEILAAYRRGRSLIEAGSYEAGSALWRQLLEELDWPERSWLLQEMAASWRRAQRWELARATLREAGDEAQSPSARLHLFLAQGETHFKQGELDLAETAYRSAQEIAVTWGDSLTLARAEDGLGNVAEAQGQFERAALHLERAHRLRQRLAPDSLDLANSLNNLGALADSRGDLEEAERHHRAALEIRRRRAPQSLDHAASLNNLGVVAFRRSDFDRAGDFFSRCLDIRQALAPGSSLVGESIGNLGVIAYYAGDLHLAERRYREALAIQSELAPETELVAKQLNNIGLVALQRGLLDEAETSMEAALTVWEKLSPDGLGAAAALTNLASVLYARGDHEGARSRHLRALAIKERLAPGSGDVAFSLGYLAVTAKAQGELEAAEGHLLRALEIWNEIEAQGFFAAEALNNLGTVYEEQGNLEAAKTSYERSLEIHRELSPGSLAEAQNLGNLGKIALAAGDLQGAKEIFSEALIGQRRVAPTSAETAATLHHLGTIERQRRKLGAAETLWAEGLEVLEAQIGSLGGTQADRAEFRAAHRGQYRDYIELLLEMGKPEAAFLALERSRARSFLALLSERDLVFSTEAPEELETTLRKLRVTYDRLQLELAHLSPERDRSSFDDLVAQLRETRRQHERIQEQIRQAAPGLAALRQPEPLGLRESQRILDPGTAMLSYSVHEKTSYLFLVSDRGSEAVTLAIGEAELRREVDGFRQLIREAWPGSPSMLGLEAAGRKLYELLVAPVAPSLAMSRRLLVVPDGPLHLLPFGALIKEADGHPQPRWQYLAEWKPMHSVLSATVYAEIQRRREREPSEAERTLVAFGDPRFSTQPQQAGEDPTRRQLRAALRRGFDFRPLPLSRSEVAAVASLYPRRSRVFLGEAATEEQAKALDGAVSRIHFATHATVDERMPLNSALVLTLPSKPSNHRDNGLLQAWEIFEQLRLRADLVVLSACESALGREVSGEGLIGLTRAFQYAGARTVAASLWPVLDDTTAELMLRFHRHLASGKAKDEALQAAQVELIQGPITMTLRGEPATRDASAPYYWSAFQLYGDWR